MAPTQQLVSTVAIEATINSFTKLDASGDRGSMNKLAKRLGKEQPALLQFAAAAKSDPPIDAVGEAAVFYATLVWAMFEREHGKQLPRLTKANLDAAAEVVAGECGKVEGFDALPIHERIAAPLAQRQPHLYAKLAELIAEDVREAAIIPEVAAAIFPPTQVVVEAFDAAVEGRRPGERIGPIVRDAPKVGRNDACPCGSGKKYKRCCGAAAG
jgi:hypothetical protein